MIDSTVAPTEAARTNSPASPNSSQKRTSKQPTRVQVKKFILDTNVLLHDPQSPLHFQNNDVLIPIEVVEEIDRFKRDSSELGQNARAIARLLDRLRRNGGLSEGVSLENGGRLQILFPDSNNGHAQGNNTDSRILQQALEVQRRNPEIPVILVTKDINLRIRADAARLAAEDYETDHVQLSELYSGTFERRVSADAMTRFRNAEEMPLEPDHSFHPNEYCTLKDESDPKHTLLAKVDPTATKLIPILDYREGLWGIRPRNRQQHFAFDALLDDRIKLVTLMGKAGTGKTLLAMAAGLKRTTVDREFRRVVVARPTISMGKELGFLPGSLDEKLSPWMQPIHDALELLGDLNMGTEGRRTSELLRTGVIVVEALSYIRGRSIANQFMIIDEAQNLTPLEVKTIITRVGNGTKIIFTGDPFQIDNPYVDTVSNGFNYLVSRFRGHAIAAHVELQKGERSELAELAANIL